MTDAIRPDLSKVSAKVRDYVNRLERDLTEAKADIALLVGENHDTQKYPFGPGYPEDGESQFPHRTVQCTLGNGVKLNMRVDDEGFLYIIGNERITLMPGSSNVIRIR